VNKLAPRIFRFVALIALATGLALASSCAFSRKKPPEPASPALRSEFDKIQIDLAAGAEKKAVTRLKNLVAAHPNTDISDDAHIVLGKIAFRNRDFQGAYDSFMAVVNSDIFSPSEAEALLWAGKSLQRLGRLDEALALTQKSVKIPGISNEMKLEIYKLRFALLGEVGDKLDALRAVVFIAANDPDPVSRDSYRVRALDFVESRLSDQELAKVANSSEFGFVRGQALFRVGVQTFEQRDFSRARDYFSSAIGMLEGSELAERAKGYIEQIDSRRQVDPRTVGAVLPLTGRYSEIAQRTLRGLQLGLGVYGADKSDLRLAVVDSEGNPDGARRAVERLVTEDHVIAVVGSLLSKTATAVASKADELGVPSIALSQKAGLTDIGDTVFRNSLTSEMQVRYLVRIAMEKMGLKRFAILYPNDAYGIEFANLFWDEVMARGGSIAAAQTYNPTDTDFSGPVQRLVGKYYVEDRGTEYKVRITDWYKKQRTLGARQKPPDDLLPPIVNFDAIFIPDGIKAMSQIAPALAYYDIKDVKMLGTNLWNSDELVRRTEKHLEGSVFVDSFLPTDQEFAESRFYKEFKKVFGEPPGPFEAQAYDAGLILRQALASGKRTRIDLMDQLAHLSDFPGGVGRLNFSGVREISRPIVPLTVMEGKIARLTAELARPSPAPGTPAGLKKEAGRKELSPAKKDAAAKKEKKKTK
jgi:branched-chain amino acid transport system substrate-binding protein